MMEHNWEAITSFTGGYAFLSNFHMLKEPVYVELDLYEEVPFWHVEGAYQFSKTYHRSIETRRMVAAKMKGVTPAVAKKMGRRMKLPASWEYDKYDIMTDLVEQKFQDDPNLARRLLDTGSAHLVEGNNWGDREWGMTFDSQWGWWGKNKLGAILMYVRGKLA